MGRDFAFCIGHFAFCIPSASTDQLQRFAEHPQDAFLVCPLEHFIGREPGDFVGFVADADFIVRMRNHEEANIVMLVSILDHLAMGIVAGWDLVHIDVERHHNPVDSDKIEMHEAGFLAGLAERNFLDKPLTVGVTAQLEPAVELAVMR